MNIRACIFDFDGILADTEELHYRSYQSVLEPLGAGFSWESYQRNYMAFDSRQAFAAALKKAGRTEAPPLEELLERKMQAHGALLADLDLPPLPGAVEAVRLAASLGPVGLCTGAQPRDVLPLVEAFGLRRYFSTLVTADDVRISKPDPESYAQAAEKLGLPASDCLAIEDTPGGLRSAKGAGCHTLGVTTTHSAEQLKEDADRVIPSLLEFSSALESF